MRLGRSRVATLLGTTALMFGVLTAAAPAEAVDYTQSYMHFNMNGNIKNKGGLQVVEDIRRSVVNHWPQPFIITLNEVCQNQYTELTKKLPRYTGAFDMTTQAASNCPGKHRFGNAIFVRTANYSVIHKWTLPNPAKREPRGLMCVKIPIAGKQPMVACVTHIDRYDANKKTQIATVARITRSYHRGHGVLVAGDFNRPPEHSDLNVMYQGTYRPSGSGIWRECDSPSSIHRGTDPTSSYYEKTHQDGKKLDYIFLSYPDWRQLRGDATNALRSDHRILRASAAY